MKDIDKGVKPVRKTYFVDNVGLFLGAREKVLISFKNKIFQTKDKILIPDCAPAPEPTPEPLLELTSESTPNQKVLDTPKTKRVKIIKIT